MAVSYDSEVHSIDDVVGTSYPKINTTGRCNSNLDGHCFSHYEYLVYGEDLSLVIDEYGNPIENPNYDRYFDPSTDNEYVIVCISGLAPVLTGTIVPSRWKKVREGLTYDLYLIR